MIGQDIPNARRVVLLIIDDKGKQHGWEIWEPARVKWFDYDLVNGSAHATIQASGEFHRIQRSGHSLEIEERMNAAAIEGAGLIEIGDPSGDPDS